MNKFKRTMVTLVVALSTGATALACDVEPADASLLRAESTLTDEALIELCADFEAEEVSMDEVQALDPSEAESEQTDPDAFATSAPPVDAFSAPGGSAGNCLWDCMDSCVSDFEVCTEMNPLALPHVCFTPFRECRQSCLNFPCPI